MYKELGDGHLISDKIENGEIFPAGGSVAGRNNIHMIVDFNSFEELFSRIEKNAKGLMVLDDVKSWYDNNKTGLDFSLFCHMMAFNNVMNKLYPDIVNVGKHNGFYGVGKPKNLSDTVANKACACTEFSVLAQGYFQRQNIPTRYVGGEVVMNGDFGDFEAHSFIAFKSNDKKYIFDPVNIFTCRGAKLPRISEVCEPENRLYIETKNIFDENERWFYSGGEKGAFLTDLPTKKDVHVSIGMLSKTDGRS